MKVIYEEQNPPPDGIVSINVRLTHAEASTLIDATTDSVTSPNAADSRAVARPIGQALKAAVADGLLKLTGLVP